MIRFRVSLPLAAASVVWAATALAQPARAADQYDPAAEIAVKGQIVGIISTQSPAGVVGVHMDVKTDTGIVKMHVGPALFIGDQNFWFMCEDQVEVVGAMVTHDGEAALWVRTIKKSDGKILTLRDAQGRPLWKTDGQTDPDGCGIAHPVIRTR